MRKHFFLLTIWLIACLFFGCKSDIDLKQSIYDDSALIVSEADSYSYFARDVLISDNSLDLKYSGFSGKETFFDLAVEGQGEMYFHARSTLESGQFKVCLIDPFGNIDTLISGSCDASVARSVYEGHYRVVFLGRSARGKISFSFKMY